MSDNEFSCMAADDVVATVVGDTDPPDSTAVREALEPVTEGDVVTSDAVETAVSDTSKIVATAETRVELAEIAFEDAVTAADHVADIEIVAARIGGYEAQLADIETDVTTLSDDLPAPVHDDPRAVYGLAVDLRRVATTAQNVAQRADELSFELERFEAWLDSPDRRYTELGGDIDLVADSVDELSTVADALPAAETPARDWADAAMRADVVSLLAADLRAEMADLRRWADREDVAFQAELADRVETVGRRVRNLVDVLNEHAEPTWRNQFNQDLSAFRSELSAFEPPVDWHHVQETLDNHRRSLFEDPVAR